MKEERVADLKVTVEKDDLAAVSARVEELHAALTTKEMSDEMVYTELLTYLAAQERKYRLLFEKAKDRHEAAAFWSLADAYGAIFRVPEGVAQWTYTYCTDEAERAWDDDELEESQTWLAIGEAFWRAARNKGEVEE